VLALFVSGHSLSYTSHAGFTFLGSVTYTSRAGFIYIWAVSLTHPMLASFLIWGVSLKHPVLVSILFGEFLLHIPC